MADMVPRSGGGDGGSTVIKLDTVRRIAEKVSQSSVTGSRNYLIFSHLKQQRKSCFACLPLTPYFCYSPGQAPSSGHHSHCSGKVELHPVPPNGPVLGPSQPQGRQGHEAEVQPKLQQELQTALHTGPEDEETLQPPFLW